uniref:Amyloid-beta A4 precursor protein-binding family A member 3 n=1 Tax=Leptobrachium leishanense TaxID=445787 RepID=A0A8C5M0Z5_9ANUR
MENGTEFQMPVPCPVPCTVDTPDDKLYTEVENLCAPQECPTGSCHKSSSQASMESVCGEDLDRAPPRVDSCPDMDTRPPRVDSCPDMDTRPPFTTELVSMDLDAQVEEAGQGVAFHMQDLLSELPTLDCQKEQLELVSTSGGQQEEKLSKETEPVDGQVECPPCPLHVVTGKGLAQSLRRLSDTNTMSSSSLGLFLTDSCSGELLSLFRCEDGSLVQGEMGTPLARLDAVPGNEPPSDHSLQHQVHVCHGWKEGEAVSPSSEVSAEDSSSLAEGTEQEWKASQEAQQSLEDSDDNSETRNPGPSSRYLPVKVPGPCDPEDLLDGVVFGAKYLGSTQLQCEKNPAPRMRMKQAQEAVDRVKAPDGESQPMTEVDVMVSTQRVKVLTADTQETLMDHSLQTISYTADIGSIVVIMARRKSPRSQEQPPAQKPQKMLCHVFQSADAQLIARAIGQAFGLAYQNFLLSEGVEPVASGGAEQLYNADLAYFSKRDNCREVYIQKQRGEVLGVAVVESGWGSLLPTVVIANLMHGGAAERSGELSIGDHITSINGTSLVGLPLSTSQGLIRELKGQSEVVLSIVRCPPVITAIVHRPEASHPLGFSVEDGVICSLVRGGIAERGGIRVGHRIIEINGQSVVATAHEKIIQTLLDATGEF